MLTQPSCRPRIVSSRLPRTMVLVSGGWASAPHGPAASCLSAGFPGMACCCVLLILFPSCPKCASVEAEHAWAEAPSEFTCACLSFPNIPFQYVPPVGQDTLRLPVGLADAHCLADSPPVACCPSSGVALWVGLHTLAAPAQGPVLPPSPFPAAGSDPRSLHAQLSGPPAAVNRARPIQGCPFGIVFICCPLLEHFNLVCQIYNLG